MSSLSLRNAHAFDYAFLSIIGVSFALRLLFLFYNHSLWAEEAYYWNYAQHLDFGYLDHPPMVAFLIKLTTSIFGTHEFSVRLASPLCWIIAVFFSFKLSNLIARGTGWYVVVLLSILPFFFLQSLVITPDQPLTACWAAALYYLYRTLVLGQTNYWYVLGIWLGLGLLSKYTIVLLGLSTLFYLSLVPSARYWFGRKEPYLCTLITVLFFMPVIYWNATHEWASFAFQGTRRLEAAYSFGLHHLLALLLFFLLPAGFLSLWSLSKGNNTHLDMKTLRFLQFFTFIPLIFFGLFSLTHDVKFNWIGPGLLAVVPWIAFLLRKNVMRKLWLITAYGLMLCYGCMMLAMNVETPKLIYNKIASKCIAWEALTQNVYEIAKDVEKETHITPIIVPLDLYNIASELSFYQAKILATQPMRQHYSIMGRHILGGESLMYKYWSNEDYLAGKMLLVISKELNDFNDYLREEQVTKVSTVNTFWAYGYGRGSKIKPYYYQLVKMR